ncbi:hypothetical protein PV328_008413 [Microctonus aethiopoides]|uniref:Uncharacterized protein n=1 Tax=Microctonus aethiopoides TaxID=144406 RepID=A0AA39KR69_9HYME|nr:hypothetical protein PV328_008413 [Microctonus aethiopoides]
MTFVAKSAIFPTCLTTDSFAAETPFGSDRSFLGLFKMNDQELITFAYLVNSYLKEKNKPEKKLWVHPINSARHQYGHYHTLYKELRKDKMKFFNYFRMSTTSFDELLLCVRDDIKHLDTNMRAAISPEEMLMITLR